MKEFNLKLSAELPGGSPESPNVPNVPNVPNLPNLPNLPVRVEANDPDAGATEGQTITQFKPKLKKPSMYKVLLLNDDFTPMDFVILILKRFFRKNEEESAKIMLQVHQQGSGIAGVFSHEIAETKVYLVNEFARSSQHPLKCIMEEESKESS